MSILSVARDYGVSPSIVRMTTNDSVAVMTAPGYLDAHMADFNRINNGFFEFSPSDILLCYSTEATTWNFFTITTDGSGFDPYPGALPATSIANAVLLTDASAAPLWLANSVTPGYVLTANAGAPASWQSVGAATGAVLLAPSANQVITGPYTLQANNFVAGYATTATAGGTTVLTVGSTNQQYFTGTLNQTVTLPVASTLVLGFQFTIVNNSTGTITVNSSGGNLVEDMQPQTQLVVTCVLASGTSAASWDTDYTADILPVVLSPLANQVITGAYTLQSNNFVASYTTTATAAGTTVLTAGSTNQQYFTGATTQTVTLPVASTLVLGFAFRIINNSSGDVTVNSSGGNAVQVMAAQSSAIVTCILTSGTTAASWDVVYFIDGNGISLTGDTGTISGSALTVSADTAALNSGSSVSFSNTGSASTLNVTDVNSNTIIGNGAGNLSMLGGANSGHGSNVLNGLTLGSFNNAFGIGAMQYATTANSNQAFGQNSLILLLTGENNVAMGSESGSSYDSNESNNICLNSVGGLGDQNTLRIGSSTGTGTRQLNAAYIQGIYSNAQLPSGQVSYVTIDISTGLLGVTTTTPVTQSVATTTQALDPNVTYIFNNAAATTGSLPASGTLTIGDVIKIKGRSAAPWIIQANTGQVITFGASSSTAAGTATSALGSDSIQFTYVAADEWSVDWAVSSLITLA